MSIEQLIFTVITTIVAVLALVVSFASWLANAKKDSGKQDAHNAIVLTKLDSIGANINDIKEDQRAFRKDLDEVKRIASHASERAEAAHNRLDRAGIDTHE